MKDRNLPFRHISTFHTIITKSNIVEIQTQYIYMVSSYQELSIWPPALGDFLHKNCSKVKIIKLNHFVDKFKMLDQKGWIENTYRDHWSNSTHNILPIIHWKIRFYTMLNIYELLDFWARLHFLRCNLTVNTNFHIKVTIVIFLGRVLSCLSKLLFLNFVLLCQESSKYTQ